MVLRGELVNSRGALEMVQLDCKQILARAGKSLIYFADCRVAKAEEKSLRAQARALLLRVGEYR